MYTRKNVPGSETSKTAYTKRTTGTSARPSAPAQKEALTEEELAARRAAARKRAAAKKKAQERKRQRRIFMVAAGMFLCAIAVLVWAVVIMVKRNRPTVTVNATPTATAYTAPAQTNAGPGASAVPTSSQTATADPGFQPPVSGTIPQGVTVNGVPVGNMTVEAARTALSQALESELDSVAIKLKSEYFNATLTRTDIGAYFDVDAALAIAAASDSGAQVKTVMLYDPDALMKALSALNDKVPGHATNAFMTIEYETYTVAKTTYQKPKFAYTEGTNGMQLDTAAVTQQIESALQSGTYQLSFAPTVTVSEPAVTVESLKKATTKLSSFSTIYYFTGSSSTDPALVENRQGRDANISKGVSMMNVITLKPGESFSFNKKTGDRSEKNGWAMANAIYNSGYQKEPGGGICQVSTTMYNALILAGVEITSHRPHTIPSDYVELGFDATVDSGHIDFKFKNNKKNTIYLFVYITKNKDSSRKKEIHVDVYGMEEPGITYKTRFEIVSEDKAENPAIKYDKKQYPDYQVKTRNAHDGYVVNTFVDKYTDNAYPQTVYSYTATYKKIEELWVYGSKPTPTPSPTKTPKPSKTPKVTPTAESFEPGY